MKMGKKAQAGAVKRLILLTIMAVVFFGVAVSVVPTMASSVNSLLGHFSTNTTVYGSGPSAIATTLANNWGYFIIVGMFSLILGIVAKIKLGRR